MTREFVFKKRNCFDSSKRLLLKGSKLCPAKGKVKSAGCANSNSSADGSTEFVPSFGNSGVALSNKVTEGNSISGQNISATKSDGEEKMWGDKVSMVFEAFFS